MTRSELIDFHLSAAKELHSQFDNTAWWRLIKQHLILRESGKHIEQARRLIAEVEEELA